jgi:hypothetical protein
VGEGAVNAIDRIIDKLPAHIWFGLSILLFGLGLTVLTSDPKAEPEPVEQGCVATQNGNEIRVDCVEDLPVTPTESPLDI